MDFKQVLESACISLHLKSTDKRGIIEELLDLMVAAGRLVDRQAALNSIIDRERKMSTGMQYGVAIPHGKTETVEELVTALGLKPEGMDFESLDGQPSKIFVMTISPVTRTGPHIEYLSQVSRVLTSPATRERLLKAKTRQEVLDIMTEE